MYPGKFQIFVVVVLAFTDSARVAQAKRFQIIEDSDYTDITTSSSDVDRGNGTALLRKSKSKCSTFETCCCLLLDRVLPPTPAEAERLCSCQVFDCGPVLTEVDGKTYCPDMVQKGIDEAYPWMLKAETLESEIHAQIQLLDGFEEAIEHLQEDNTTWVKRLTPEVRTPLTSRLEQKGESLETQLTALQSRIEAEEDVTTELTSTMDETLSTLDVDDTAADNEEKTVMSIRETLKNLTQCFHHSSCHRDGGSSWIPALHISGYATWTPIRGMRGAETIVDFHTLESASFQYRGHKVGLSSFSVGGSAYTGIGWKGELYEKTLDKVYSGPFVAVEASVGLPFLNMVGVGATLTTSAGENWKPQPRQVKTLTFGVGGNLIQAIPAQVLDANALFTEAKYVSGRCFQTPKEFFRYLWNGADYYSTDNLSRSKSNTLRNLRPLVWLQRLVMSALFVMHRNSARPKCSQYAKPGGVQSPAAVLSRLRHFSALKMSAASEIRRSLSTLHLAPPHRICCCDYKHNSSGFCAMVVPKTNERCPKADLGYGQVQTQPPNEGMPGCDAKQLGGVDGNVGKLWSWSYEDLGQKLEEVLRGKGIGKKGLAVLHELTDCRRSAEQNAGTRCVWRCKEDRANCLSGKCLCQDSTCFDPRDGRCVPIDEARLRIALTMLEASNAQDNQRIVDLAGQSLCWTQQDAFDTYCKQPKLTNSACQIKTACTSARPKVVPHSSSLPKLGAPPDSYGPPNFMKPSWASRLPDSAGADMISHFGAL